MLFLAQNKTLSNTVLETVQKFFTDYPWLVLAIGIGILVIAATVIFIVMGRKREEPIAEAEGIPTADVSPEKAPVAEAVTAEDAMITPATDEAKEEATAPSIPPSEENSILATPEDGEAALPPVKKAAPRKRTPKADAVAPTAEMPPVKEEAPAEVTAPEISVTPVAPPKTERQTAVSGRYVFVLAEDGYHFCLLANNGQLLYESVGYTTLNGAKSGVETFRRAATAKNARFMIRNDRGGKYSYVLNGKFYGEGYTAKQRCERAILSVQRFAGTENFTEPTFTQEEIDRYATAKASLKSGTEADFAAMEQLSATRRKSGKFMIDTEDGGASFSLLANNGKCLYTSRLFSDAATAEKAIYAFKKAVYLDNFFVTDDKFGNFRFALKGTGSNWYVGDSYATKERCINSIASVKQFTFSAEVVYATEDEEPTEE